MVETYFFDTYALIEVIEGSKNYARYVDCECKTSLLNLIEVYYYGLRDLGAERAKYHFGRLESNALEIAEEDVFKAMEFKLANKNKGLSYTDCVGYAMAKNRGVRFLTGDEQFRSMPNVEFVK